MCPLDRVLTYKNLIYLLNLQILFVKYSSLQNTIKITFCLQSRTATTIALIVLHLHPGRSFLLVKTFFLVDPRGLGW